MDWGAFFMGFTSGVALEVAIGVFITARFAWYWFRKHKVSILKDFFADQETASMMRQYIMNGLMGNAGGRPVNPMTLLKQGASQMIGYGIQYGLNEFGKMMAAQQAAQQPPQ